MSTERRQEFVKLIKKMSEDGRVSIRHVRREAMDLFKKHGHDSGITEDQKKQAEKDLQKLTDDYIAKIDAPRRPQGKRNHDGVSQRPGLPGSRQAREI